MNSRIRAVTFDVGGTLIEPWPSVGHVYGSVAREHGVASPEPEVLTRRFAEVWKARTEFDYSRGAWLELVTRTFGDALPEARRGAVFEAIYRRFELPDSWRVFAEVREVLLCLRGQGLTLGLVSNWDERLRPLLDRLGLSDSFEVIVISHEIGHVKPHSKIFLEAADRLGEKPDAVLHVGDSRSEDYLGARAAGLTGILLQRGGATPGIGVIGCLRELLDLLEKG